MTTLPLSNWKRSGEVVAVAVGCRRATVEVAFQNRNKRARKKKKTKSGSTYTHTKKGRCSSLSLSE
jgi:hypothetical protein